VTQETSDAAEGHTAPRCDAALSAAFSLLGKRWNGVILGTLMSGPAGFSEIRRALGGISDSVLSDRLSELTAVGVRYQLAEPGKALMPALTQLMTWARNNL
jgi:DNA-binding HxlR family transcriptional regulator